MASSNIEEALYTRLVGDTDITGDLAQRIFVGRAEENTPTPYAVYQVVSDPHDAFAFAAVNSGQPRIQFDIYSTDRYDALSIAHNVRKRVRHYGGTWDGMTILRCEVGGTRMLPEPDRSDIWRASLDIMPQYIDAS